MFGFIKGWTVALPLPPLSGTTITALVLVIITAGIFSSLSAATSTITIHTKLVGQHLGHGVEDTLDVSDFEPDDLDDEGKPRPPASARSPSVVKITSSDPSSPLCHDPIRIIDDGSGIAGNRIILPPPAPVTALPNSALLSPHLSDDLPSVTSSIAGSDTSSIEQPAVSSALSPASSDGTWHDAGDDDDDDNTRESSVVQRLLASSSPVKNPSETPSAAAAPVSSPTSPASTPSTPSPQLRPSSPRSRARRTTASVQAWHDSPPTSSTGSKTRQPPKAPLPATPSTSIGLGLKGKARESDTESARQVPLNQKRGTPPSILRRQPQSFRSALLPLPSKGRALKAARFLVFPPEMEHQWQAQVQRAQMQQAFINRQQLQQQQALLSGPGPSSPAPLLRDSGISAADSAAPLSTTAPADGSSAPVPPSKDEAASSAPVTSTSVSIVSPQVTPLLSGTSTPGSPWVDTPSGSGAGTPMHPFHPSFSSLSHPFFPNAAAAAVAAAAAAANRKRTLKLREPDWAPYASCHARAKEREEMRSKTLMARRASVSSQHSAGSSSNGASGAASATGSGSNGGLNAEHGQVASPVRRRRRRRRNSLLLGHGKTAEGGAAPGDGSTVANGTEVADDDDSEWEWDDAQSEPLSKDGPGPNGIPVVKVNQPQDDDDDAEQEDEDFWFERYTRSTAAAGKDWDWRKRRARILIPAPPPGTSVPPGGIAARNTSNAIGRNGVRIPLTLPPIPTVQSIAAQKQAALINAAAGGPVVTPVPLPSNVGKDAVEVIREDRALLNVPSNPGHVQGSVGEPHVIVEGSGDQRVVTTRLVSPRASPRKASLPLNSEVREVNGGSGAEKEKSSDVEAANGTGKKGASVDTVVPLLEFGASGTDKTPSPPPLSSTSTAAPLPPLAAPSSPKASPPLPAHSSAKSSPPLAAASSPKLSPPLATNASPRPSPPLASSSSSRPSLPPANYTVIPRSPPLSPTAATPQTTLSRTPSVTSGSSIGTSRTRSSMTSMTSRGSMPSLAGSNGKKGGLRAKMVMRLIQWTGGDPSMFEDEPLARHEFQEHRTLPLQIPPHQTRAGVALSPGGRGDDTVNQVRDPLLQRHVTDPIAERRVTPLQLTPQLNRAASAQQLGGRGDSVVDANMRPAVRQQLQQQRTMPLHSQSLHSRTSSASGVGGRGGSAGGSQSPPTRHQFMEHRSMPLQLPAHQSRTSSEGDTPKAFVAYQPQASVNRSGSLRSLPPQTRASSVKNLGSSGDSADDNKSLTRHQFLEQRTAPLQLAPHKTRASSVQNFGSRGDGSDDNKSPTRHQFLEHRTTPLQIPAHPTRASSGSHNLAGPSAALKQGLVDAHMAAAEERAPRRRTSSDARRPEPFVVPPTDVGGGGGENETTREGWRKKNAFGVPLRLSSLTSRKGNGSNGNSSGSFGKPAPEAHAQRKQQQRDRHTSFSSLLRDEERVQQLLAEAEKLSSDEEDPPVQVQRMSYVPQVLMPNAPEASKPISTPSIIMNGHHRSSVSSYDSRSTNFGNGGGPNNHHGGGHAAKGRSGTYPNTSSSPFVIARLPNLHSAAGLHRTGSPPSTRTTSPPYINL
ncbi:hypothetical protein V8E36_000094 [Tilletia maclaganii]